ncbi:MAG: hypothetical protein U1F26_12990 [Lysobacterales bacterium]
MRPATAEPSKPPRLAGPTPEAAQQGDRKPSEEKQAGRCEQWHKAASGENRHHAKHGKKQANRGHAGERIKTPDLGVTLGINADAAGVAWTRQGVTGAEREVSDPSPAVSTEFRATCQASLALSSEPNRLQSGALGVPSAIAGIGVSHPVARDIIATTPQ